MDFENLKEKSFLLLQTIGSLIFVGIYILGFYHSCTKHKDEGNSYIYNPFLTIYRGIEIFWHDDFADVNWDIRLTSDCEYAINLINQYSDKNKNMEDFNKNLENFVEKIQKYPTGKFERIKGFTNLYIQYSYSFFDDLYNVIIEYPKSGTYIYIESSKTKKIKSEMSTYVSPELMNMLETQIKSYIEAMEKRILEFEVDELAEKLKTIGWQLKHYFDIIKSNNRYIFKKIFGEDLKEIGEIGGGGVEG